MERAEENGFWEILDSVERLEVPDDLAAALDSRPPAAGNFMGFPPSTRKQLLQRVEPFGHNPSVMSLTAALVAP